jgi:hypothetical protein
MVKDKKLVTNMKPMIGDVVIVKFKSAKALVLKKRLGLLRVRLLDEHFFVFGKMIKEYTEGEENVVNILYHLLENQP